MSTINFSYDPEWLDTLSAPFMTNAFIAGLCIALAAGVMGYFTIARRSTFAAHALAHIGLPGATGAVLLGLPVSLGMGVFALGGALVIGALGKRVSEREIATGTVLAFATGLGLFFARLSSSASQQMQSIRADERGVYGDYGRCDHHRRAGSGHLADFRTGDYARGHRQYSGRLPIQGNGDRQRAVLGVDLGRTRAVGDVPRSPELHHRDAFHPVLGYRQSRGDDAEVISSIFSCPRWRIHSGGFVISSPPRHWRWRRCLRRGQ